MVILGISTSGRKIKKNEQGNLIKGVTEELVKYVLKNIDGPTEYISLNGKIIRGCIGCLKCADDNVCELQDD